MLQRDFTEEAIGTESSNLLRKVSNGGWFWIIMKNASIIWGGMLLCLVKMSPTQAGSSSEQHVASRSADQLEANVLGGIPLPSLERFSPKEDEGTEMVNAQSDNGALVAPEDKLQRSLDVNMTINEETEAKPHVLLVIAVPSIRPSRRQAIRDTWLTWKDDRVVLRFFTEGPETTDYNETAMLAEESRTYGDLVQLDIQRGKNFGLKLLEAMRWMSENYTFDFFLRLDDDYFLCLQRLLDDLSSLPGSSRYQSPFMSGSVACSKKGAYVDEAYILIPSEIIHRILSTPDLRCCSMGALTISAWLSVGGPCNLEGDVQWVGDHRLNYGGKWWDTGGVDQSLVCQYHMGVHRTYQEKMYEVWALHPNASGPVETFIYEDTKNCPYAAANYTEARLERFSGQPCDTFTVANTKIWCGVEGC